MPERSASGRVSAELEAELARLDPDQLLRLCAHLIRTYVIEPGRAGVTGAAPAEQQAAAVPSLVPPPVATLPAPAAPPAPVTQERRTRAEPKAPAPDSDDRFNKLEMD